MDTIKKIKINEGTKTIALFLGYQLLNKKFQIKNFNSSNESYFETDEGEIVCDENGNEVNLYPDGDPLFELEELPFYTSWDYIAIAVRKLKAMAKEIAEENQSNHVFAKMNEIDNSLIELDIDKLFFAVLENIKWIKLFN